MPCSRSAASFVFAALVATAATAATCAPSSARADSGDARRAEALDAEATSLMERRRFAEACPKLAESDRLKPGTGVLMRLGLCYERLGKTASAWSTYRVAATRAELAGDGVLRDLATKRADALEPRVPAVRVQLPADVDADTIELACDGVPVDRATLRAGAPLRLDPGEHTLEASAPGRRPLRTTFVVDSGATRSIAIDLAPAATPARSLPEAPPRAESDSAGAAQRTTAIVVGGVGVAALGVGSVLGVSAMTKWNRARGECASGTTGCSADALELEQTVRTEALWSTVAFTVGAVGLVGGAVLWWTAPRSEARAAYSIRPIVTGDRVGVSLGGRF